MWVCHCCYKISWEDELKVYRGRGLGDFYYDLIQDITNEGVEIITRGKRCLELPEPVTLVYDSPGYCWMDVPERKFNPFFAMAEVPWILSGNGNAEWICYFNSNMKTFLDDGLEEFHGAYGIRMRKWPAPTFAKDPTDRTGRSSGELDQIAHVVLKLKEDPFSRQAVISLWDPVRDNLFKSLDIPCNNIVYYRLRNGFLHQTVVIRSNDVVWGTPHNAIQFTHLHALVAGELGVKMGSFTYVVQNLHYYIDDTYSSTLGHIVNAACSGEILDAQNIEGFCTVPDDRIYVCMETINNMKEGKREPLHNDYWTGIIPKLLWVYIAAKDRKSSIDRLCGLAKELPAPLPKLISEFWRDSKNPIAVQVAHALR
jgi:thymidylate synthase